MRFRNLWRRGGKIEAGFKKVGGVKHVKTIRTWFLSGITFHKFQSKQHELISIQTNAVDSKLPKLKLFYLKVQSFNSLLVNYVPISVNHDWPLCVDQYERMNVNTYKK